MPALNAPEPGPRADENLQIGDWILDSVRAAERALDAATTTAAAADPDVHDLIVFVGRDVWQRLREGPLDPAWRRTPQGDPTVAGHLVVMLHQVSAEDWHIALQLDSAGNMREGPNTAPKVSSPVMSAPTADQRLTARPDAIDGRLAGLERGQADLQRGVGALLAHFGITPGA